MCCGSRYPHNDTTLIMEKVILDLGRYVKHAKEVLGYKKVILAGWSGGGSLSMFYQAEAEDPSVTSTPAGDMPDLTKAGLEPADGNTAGAVCAVGVGVARRTGVVTSG